jgi:hypothetical protein
MKMKLGEKARVPKNHAMQEVGYWSWSGINALVNGGSVRVRFCQGAALTVEYRYLQLRIYIKLINSHQPIKIKPVFVFLGLENA